MNVYVCAVWSWPLHMWEIISQDEGVCEVGFFVMGCFAAKPILTYVVTYETQLVPFSVYKK